MTSARSEGFAPRLRHGWRSLKTVETVAPALLAGPPLPMTQSPCDDCRETLLLGPRWIATEDSWRDEEVEEWRRRLGIGD